jgi:hypothetical protein
VLPPAAPPEVPAPGAAGLAGAVEDGGGFVWLVLPVWFEESLQAARARRPTTGRIVRRRMNLSLVIKSELPINGGGEHLFQRGS